MQKILIENFGPINKAEIEIKPFLILIGEQASGKSTVAKLIYFFKSLAADFLIKCLDSPSVSIGLVEDLARDKFAEYFGSTHQHQNFRIEYYYGPNCTLSLTPSNDSCRLDVNINNDFASYWNSITGCKMMLRKIDEELEQTDEQAMQVLLRQKQSSCMSEMSNVINALFSNEHNDSLFILAGRQATVGYGESFSDILTSSIRQRIENQGKKNFDTKEQTIDEIFLLEFLQRVAKIRQFFVKYGDFDGIIRSTADGRKKSSLEVAYRTIQNILRGKYTHDNVGERVDHEDGQYVYLKNASSGQQEIIRILQDAFACMYTGNNVFRVIEEPEAHLFPESQLNVIYLLAELLNANSKNQLIITTHSPYILSSVNNLMFAAQTGRDAEGVNDVIPSDYWLNPEKVGAYMLCDGGVEDIVDNGLDLIQVERIDSVSTKINGQFDMILNMSGDEAIL